MALQAKRKNKSRKKIIVRLGLFLMVVLLSSPFLVIGIRNATDWAARTYVSSQLDMKTGEWSEIFDEFETRFEPGMSRQEVLDILLELDPSLEDKLRTDDELRNGRGCLAKQRVTGPDFYTCIDVILLFDGVLVIDLATSLDYGFVYDQDMQLVRSSRPPSM